MKLLRQNVTMLVNGSLCGPGNEERSSTLVGSHINFPLRKGYLCEQKQSSLKAHSQGRITRDL